MSLLGGTFNLLNSGRCMANGFRLFFTGFIILFFVCPASANSAQEINRYVSAHQSDQLKLLEKLVNINSGTTNLVGVRQVGEILRPLFAELGFTTRWVEEPAAFNRIGTLVAEKKGSRGKRLLLIGHLDTVFPSNSPFQRFERKGNFACGPGVIDDKGGDVVILYALKALAATHHLEDVTITVVLTGDEESSGKPTAISRRPLLAAAKQSDIALDFEWAFALDSATIARRGIATWLLQMTGKEAHSAEIFQKSIGAGAIFAMARILNSMYQELSQEKYLSFNPGLILGGTQINFDKNNSSGTVAGKDNIIAKKALASGDLRFLTQAQKINAEKNISNIVKKNLTLTKATIEFKDGIPSMPPTAANLDLLKEYSAISIALGWGPVHRLDPGLRGAGDISYIAQEMKANLAGLGAAGTGAHSQQETLDISSLPIETARAAVLIYHLTR